MGECFICDQSDPVKNIRKTMTLSLHARLQRCAENLLDGELLAKLSGGDMVAQEYMYHAACLTGVYNRERSWMSAQNADT